MNDSTALRIGGFPTIVLISGQLRLTDGSVVDSRQPTEDEPTARAIQVALTSSVDWWMAVSSIVLPTLAHPPGGFAVILGRRSAQRADATGEIRRSSLRRLLRGGVGSISIVRSGIEASPPASHTPVLHLRSGQGTHMGSLGVRLDDPPPAWCFVDGNEFYLRLAVECVGARAIVDTAGDLVASIGRGAEAASLSVARDAAALQPPQLVVAPDTPMIRRQIVGALQGERPRAEEGQPPPPYSPRAPRPASDFLRFAALQADCAVTGWLRGGNWEDPSPLEAARQLVLQRYDLRLGLWDVALNPTLRATLLVAAPPTDPSSAIASAPQGARERAAEAAQKAYRRRTLAARRTREATRILHSYLAPHGWKRDSDHLRLPLTDSLPSRPGGKGSSLAALRLDVGKRKMFVTASHGMYNDLDIAAFVLTRREAFNAVAPLPSVAGTPGAVHLWTAPWGWGNSTLDWSRLATEVADCTDRWRALFVDFVASCRHRRLQRPARA